MGGGQASSGEEDSEEVLVYCRGESECRLQTWK
jgi:hypothetical protein